MQVLGTRVLIEKAEPKQASQLVHIKPEDENKGYVRQVGDKVEYLKVGDHVAYVPNSGTGVMVNGEKRLLMDESEVLAVLG